MGESKGFGGWRPAVGVVGVAFFACSVAIWGAPVEKGKPARGHAPRTGYPSLTDLPVAPPVHAYRTQTVLLREGPGLLPLSYGSAEQAGPKTFNTLGTCSVPADCDDGDPCTTDDCVSMVCVNTPIAGCCLSDVDCDDCNLCTEDVCNIPPNTCADGTPCTVDGDCAGIGDGLCDNPPPVTGTCSNDNSPLCDSCPDGTFCNGREICDGAGACQPATSPGCADQPGTICDEKGGPTRTGECADPCFVDSDCDDGLACTGVEVCVLQECVGGDNEGAACTDDTPCTGGGMCGGVCRSQGLPCGSIPGCRQFVCSGGQDDGKPCTTPAECGIGSNCLIDTFECTINGRCCANDGFGNWLECSRATKPDCFDPGAGGDATNRWLNIGDNPSLDGDQATCTAPAPPSASNAGEDFQCPVYAASTDTADPTDLANVITGFVGHAACADFSSIGDDYKIAGAGPNTFVEVTTIRVVLEFLTEGIPGSVSRYRVTFYDKFGNFIEDSITNPTTGGPIALRTVIFQEKPVIPSEGFFVIRPAPRFSPFARVRVALAASVDTGTNDKATLWVNGAPTTALSGVLPPALDDGQHGMLAFEIVGNVVSTPTGACCDIANGGCVEQLPWVCENPDLGGFAGFFQGIGTSCQVCENDFLKSCGSDADCPFCTGGDNDGQACDPNAQCPAGETCVSGLCSVSGTACDVNVECPNGGTCGGSSPCNPSPPACALTACCVQQTGTLVCVGGPNNGSVCVNDSHCPGGQCLAAAQPGDCVQASASGCSQTVPGPECVGVGAPPPADCAVGEICLPDPSSSTGGRCFQQCFGDADCAGGSTCDAPCPVGSVANGFGTNCDPNCCEQPNIADGYDTCQAASDAIFTTRPELDVAVPPPGAPPKVLTFTGNNLGATFNDNPGTCEFGIFDPNGGTQDRGWWHAFSINACANIRMDFCCTDPVKQPAWANLWNTCNPCATTLTASVVGSPVGTNTASGDRGSPFCLNDNLWETFGPVPKGIYWYPAFSAPSGTRGQYQIHFTIAGCPLAACCLPEKMCVLPDDTLAGVTDGVGTPTACGTDTDCAAFAGATCELCAVVNVLDCDAADGFWNGLGRIALDQDPITTCDLNPCERGSCCLGPGQCDDTAPGSDTCDPLIPSTCMTRADCTGLGTFVGAAFCDNPVKPCPACTIVGGTNCQLPDTTGGGGNGLGFMSDLDAHSQSGVVTADDFIPQGDTVSKICVWGEYLNPDLADQEPVAFDCTGSVADEFRVRIFLDGAEDADPNTPPGLPGTLVGESLVTGANIGMGAEQGTSMEAVYGVVAQGYTLTLDTPISGLQTNKVHWLEVANNTAVPEGNSCVWHWHQHYPETGDGYSAVGISPIVAAPGATILDQPSVYVNRSARGGTDLSFCLDIGFDTPPAPLGCCWTCGTPPVPEVTTLRECTGVTTDDDRLWDRDDPTCANAEPPAQPNDFCQAAAVDCPKPAPACGDGCVDDGLGEQCDDGNLVPGDGCDEFCQFEDPCAVPPAAGGAGALQVTDGLFGYDNSCANNDGPTLINGGPTQPEVAFGADIWYAYTATCTGRAVFDQCPTQTGIRQDGNVASDAIIAVYHDFNNPTECPCPGSFQGISPLQAGPGSDEGCNGIFDAGPGFVDRIVFPGECWLVRVGGFASAEGASGQTGRGLLSIACEESLCFPSDPPEPEMIANCGGGQSISRKNRYLSFQGGNPGRRQAVRVTFVSLPPPWSQWNGVKMWVGPPFQASQVPGEKHDDPPTGPTYTVARLQCEPFYMDWSTAGVVHVFHAGIVPSDIERAGGGGFVNFPAEYDLQFVDETCATTVEGSFSPALSLETAGWSDVGCPFNGSKWPEPDNSVDTAIDVVALQQAFGNNGGTGGTLIKPRSDLLGVTAAGNVPTPDGKIDIQEVLFAQDAFTGDEYPFTPNDVQAGPQPPCSGP